MLLLSHKSESSATARQTRHQLIIERLRPALMVTIAADEVEAIVAMMIGANLEISTLWR